MLKIGEIELKNDLLLAPMAGFTDAGFRGLCAEYGASLTCTEMVSAKGLVYGGGGTRSLLIKAENEKPCAVQLFGGEPEFIYKAAKSDELKEFDIIDINMGCPVHKIVKNGEGSALLKDDGLIGEIVAAAVEGGGRPVTVKIRLGFDEGEFTALSNALAIEKAGGAAVTVHGRTRSQFYGGKADWDAVAEVKKAVRIPVIVNGDITDRASYLKALEFTGADGVMIGRGALGRPYVFSEIADKAYDFNAKDAILKHINAQIRYLPERVVANNMKKHICFYAKNSADNKRIKAEVNGANGLTELLSAIEKFF